MDIMKKFLSLLQDDYKVGVEKQAQKNILYFDHSKVDAHALEKHASNKDMARAADEIAKQLDEQYPGISRKLPPANLIQLYKDAQTIGPFADPRLNNFNICIINMPQANELNKDALLKTFQIDQMFDPALLKPLPGAAAPWKQFVGEHEGAHCNEKEITFHNDPDAAFKLYQKEAMADRAAINSLRAQGHHDIAQAVIDIRALSAASGNDIHATGIFLGEKNQSDITRLHHEAAQTFLEEMNLAVADQLKISDKDAALLRSNDPRRYTTALSHSLEQEKIPVPRDADPDLIQERVAQKMGLAPADLTNPHKADPRAAYAAYQEIKDHPELKLVNRNPYIKEYITQYIGAVDRMLVADTTPQITVKATVAAPPAPVAPTSPDAEDLKYQAQRQREPLLDEAVAQSLQLDEAAVESLKEDDPHRYAQVAQDLLDNNKIPLQTAHTKSPAEIKNLIHAELDISEQDYKQTPLFLIQLAHQKLEEEGKYITRFDNPYLKEQLQSHIDEKKTEAASRHAPMQNPPQISERFGYLSHAKPDTNKGVPAVALHQGDKAILSVGKLSMPEYFALQADQVLAQQNLSAKMTESKDLQNITPLGNEQPAPRERATGLQTMGL